MSRDQIGRAWCALPGKIRLDNTGKVRSDAAGKPLYAAVLQWRNRELGDRFSDAVIAAIRWAYPGALDGESAP